MLSTLRTHTLVPLKAVVGEEETSSGDSVSALLSEGIMLLELRILIVG